jgi:hypothetical protein
MHVLTLPRALRRSAARRPRPGCGCRPGGSTGRPCRRHRRHAESYAASTASASARRETCLVFYGCVFASLAGGC